MRCQKSAQQHINCRHSTMFSYSFFCQTNWLTLSSTLFPLLRWLNWIFSKKHLSFSSTELCEEWVCRFVDLFFSRVKKERESKNIIFYDIISANEANVDCLIQTRNFSLKFFDFSFPFHLSFFSHHVLVLEICELSSFVCKNQTTYRWVVLKSRNPKKLYTFSLSHFSPWSIVKMNPKN
jgi:hypothetical protein